MGVMLDLIGFDAGLPVQSERTLLTLGLLLTGGGLISFQLARLFYRRYPLTQESQQTLRLSIKKQIIRRTGFRQRR